MKCKRRDFREITKTNKEPNTGLISPQNINREKRKAYHPCNRLWRLMVYSRVTTSSFLPLLFLFIFLSSFRIHLQFHAQRSTKLRNFILHKFLMPFIYYTPIITYYVSEEMAREIERVRRWNMHHSHHLQTTTQYR